ncbi:MAG: hypothetical protein J2P19_14065 [Pseudonocardia sp.]|nr:hypothetical protein [Pseudonocardia sp.]
MPIPVGVDGNLFDLLLDIHRKLLDAATTSPGPGLAQYLIAAGIVSRLLGHSGNRRVASDEIRGPVRRCLTEIVTVLQTWDSHTHSQRVYRQFALAHAWADHVDHIVIAELARARCHQHRAPEPIN